MAAPELRAFECDRRVQSDAKRERAIPLPEVDRHPSAVGITGHNVQMRIAVEVGQCEIAAGGRAILAGGRPRKEHGLAILR